jgi:D-alanyl-D-alanine dipeptidase
MRIPKYLFRALLSSLFLVAVCCMPCSAEAPEGQQTLVELVKMDPTFRLDIRYASDRNFMGFPLYSQPRAFLQRDAAEALGKVNQDLRKDGLGLLILDAYRPLSVTKLMWDKTPPSKRDYVANPKDGSRHNRGAAVDLTIIDLETGRPVAMPSQYDDFSMKAHHSYQGGTELARANRARLRSVMEKHGFEALSNEWWHYDYQGWEKYPLMDKSFEEL